MSEDIHLYPQDAARIHIDIYIYKYIYIHTVPSQQPGTACATTKQASTQRIVIIHSSLHSTDLEKQQQIQVDTSSNINPNPNLPNKKTNNQKQQPPPQFHQVFVLPYFFPGRKTNSKVQFYDAIRLDHGSQWRRWTIIHLGEYEATMGIWLQRWASKGCKKFWGEQFHRLRMVKIFKVLMFFLGGGSLKLQYL